jgi:hypothetical protein
LLSSSCWFVMVLKCYWLITMQTDYGIQLLRMATRVMFFFPDLVPIVFEWSEKMPGGTSFRQTIRSTTTNPNYIILVPLERVYKVLYNFLFWSVFMRFSSSDIGRLQRKESFWLVGQKDITMGDLSEGSNCLLDISIICQRAQILCVKIDKNINNLSNFLSILFNTWNLIHNSMLFLKIPRLYS